MKNYGIEFSEYPCSRADTVYSAAADLLTALLRCSEPDLPPQVSDLAIILPLAEYAARLLDDAGAAVCFPFCGEEQDIFSDGFLADEEQPVCPIRPGGEAAAS